MHGCFEGKQHPRAYMGICRFLVILEALAAALECCRPGLVEQFVAHYNALQLGAALKFESRPCHALLKAGMFPYFGQRFQQVDGCSLHESQGFSKPVTTLPYPYRCYGGRNRDFERVLGAWLRVRDQRVWRRNGGRGKLGVER